MPKNTSLKNWFVVHFVVDFLIAIPLFLYPELFLTFFGWNKIDPLMSRLVASALFGIGGISFFARNSSAETFIILLDLKIIWSLSAIVGFIISILQGGYPKTVWAFLLIFVCFSCIWMYYRSLLISQSDSQ